MRQQTHPLAIVIRCAIVRQRRSRDSHPLFAGNGDWHALHLWTVRTFNAAVARFLETGGGPPEGVKMSVRWHGMDYL